MTPAGRTCVSIFWCLLLQVASWCIHGSPSISLIWRGRMATPIGRFVGPSTLPRRLPSPTKRQIQSVSCLMTSIFYRITKVLSWHNFKPVGLPPRKMSSLRQSAKDDLELKTPEVYSIPCECGKVYIDRQTVRLTPGWRSASDISI
jgi:hypothetical protein